MPTAFAAAPAFAGEPVQQQSVRDVTEASVTVSKAIPGSIHQGVNQCFTANVELPNGWTIQKYEWIRHGSANPVSTTNKLIFKTSAETSGIYGTDSAQGIDYTVYVDIKTSDGDSQTISAQVHQNAASLHSFTQTHTVDPTCTTAGYTTRTCHQPIQTYDPAADTVINSFCSYSEKLDGKDALGHTAGAKWKFDDTNHWHECVRNDIEMDKAEHSYGAWTTVTPATCTKKGSESRSCAACGYSETREIPATGHTYPATYAHDNSSHWQICTVCGEKTEKVAHTFGNWTVITEPTTTATGLKERACTVCGVRQTEAIPAKGEDVKPEPGKTFTVTFDDLLADTENQTVSVKEGETVTKPAQDPALDGYRFDGWYLWNKQDGFAKMAFDFSTPVTGDLTLYAKWTKLEDGSANNNQGGSENNGNQNQNGSNKGDGNVTGVGGAVGDNEQSDNTAVDKKADKKQKDGNALPQTGDPMSIAALAGIAASGAGFVAAGSAIARKRR